jgi:hypothetical protein
MIPKRLTDEINNWIDEKRYGKIEINFSGGKIVNYNVTQSLKVEMIFSNNPEVKVTADSNNLE